MLSGFDPFNNTNWVLLFRESFNQFRVFPFMPLKCSFRSFSCATLSKALLKSKRIRSVCFPSCMFLASSSTSMRSCVSQDLFSQNPCCRSNRMFWSAKCLEIPEATTCSNTLQRMPVREIGR